MITLPNANLIQCLFLASQKKTKQSEGKSKGTPNMNLSIAFNALNLILYMLKVKKQRKSN